MGTARCTRSSRGLRPGLTDHGVFLYGGQHTISPVMNADAAWRGWRHGERDYWGLCSATYKPTTTRKKARKAAKTKMIQNNPAIFDILSANAALPPQMPAVSRTARAAFRTEQAATHTGSEEAQVRACGRAGRPLGPQEKCEEYEQPYLGPGGVKCCDTSSYMGTDERMREFVLKVKKFLAKPNPTDADAEEMWSYLNAPGRWQPWQIATIHRPRLLTDLLIKLPPTKNTGETPLMWVMDQRSVNPRGEDLNGDSWQVRMTRDLIKAGANVDAMDNDGETALHRVMYEDDLSLALLQGGANPNIKIESGETLLHGACSRHYSTLVRELIQRGTDVNAQDLEGVTPLMHACSSGYINVVIELLNANADVGLEDNDGDNALHFAKYIETPEEAPGTFVRMCEILFKVFAHRHPHPPPHPASSDSGSW